MHAGDVERLALAATDWTVAHLDDVADDASLYHGRAGIALALLDAHRHVGDDRYADALARLTGSLEDDVEELEDCSLFAGLTGVAVALSELGRVDAAHRALDRVRAAYDGRRWGPMYELFLGNAGVALGALQVGDVDLALDAVTPYLSTADPTPGGVNWAVRPSPARSHHVAHGTLGIVLALAAVGRAAGRDDLVDLALAGAADVVARDEAAPDGFLVPHSDPPHRPDLIERYSYGWCNGPAGDASVFAFLAEITGDDAWEVLQERCRHTVRTSGLPARLRPGSGTTTAAAVARPACWRSPSNGRTSPWPPPSSTTWPPAPSSTRTAPGGRTTSTGPTRATCRHARGGRWATPASCRSCCATCGGPGWPARGGDLRRRVAVPPLSRPGQPTGSAASPATRRSTRIEPTTSTSSKQPLASARS